MNSKIHKLAENTYYLPGATNVGIITEEEKNKTNIYLIDSGMNEEDGLRIYNEIKKTFSPKTKFKIKAIICTHSHADHTGANALFQKKTNCQIWATYGESGSILNPFLQAAVVWGGNPLDSLKNSYYLAETSKVTKIISENTAYNLLDKGLFEFIPLPGHYFDMIGILYTNPIGKKTFFAGDGFFGRKHILKYWIPFVYDSAQFKKSLEKILTIKAAWYIPGHGTPVKHIEPCIEMNMIAILSTEICICKILKDKSLTQEEILKEMADMNAICLRPAQYALIGSTLRAYLASMHEEGKIGFRMEDNRLLWFCT